MDILDHLTVIYEFPGDMHVNFEANQISPAGFKRVGEEFTGAKGVLEISPRQMLHHRGSKDVETIESKCRNHAIEAFIGCILSGEVDKVAERSRISTLFANLGRTAIYTNGEVTWKGQFGDIGA